MNEDQKERVRALSDQRYRVYRVYALDTDGAYLDDQLYGDLAEAQDFIGNYEDAVGSVVIFEVIQ